MTKFVHQWFLWSPLFIYFSLVGSYLHILWLRARTSGDLFCTYTFFWWPILYTRNFLMAYYEHIPPNADLIYIKYVPPLHDLLCTLMIFMDYFVHFLLFGELIFTCHILRPNARSSGDLFCTYVTFWLLFLYCPCWPTFDKYHVFMT